MSKQVYAKHASPKHGSTIFMQLHLEYLPLVAECFCNVFPVFCFSKSHSVVSPTFQINNLRYHINRHSASPAVNGFRGVSCGSEERKFNLFISLGVENCPFCGLCTKMMEILPSSYARFQEGKSGLPRHSESGGNAKLRAEIFYFSCLLRRPGSSCSKAD